MSDKLVLIGASTGGPGHLNKLLKGIKNNHTPIVIAQHMNSIFVPYFVSQFQKEVDMKVHEVDKIYYLDDGIYICNQTSMISENLPLSIKPIKSDSIYNPNINTLFNSAITSCNFKDVLAILLTGIGDDGANGLFELYKAGAKCIGENEESAIVYGMPKKAKEINPNLLSLPLHKIKENLERFLYVF